MGRRIWRAPETSRRHIMSSPGLYSRLESFSTLSMLNVHLVLLISHFERLMSCQMVWEHWIYHQWILNLLDCSGMNHIFYHGFNISRNVTNLHVSSTWRNPHRPTDLQRINHLKSDMLCGSNVCALLTTATQRIDSYYITRSLRFFSCWYITMLKYEYLAMLFYLINSI